jgi:hypothetical protein
VSGRVISLSLKCILSGTCKLPPSGQKTNALTLQAAKWRDRNQVPQLKEEGCDVLCGHGYLTSQRAVIG